MGRNEKMTVEGFQNGRARRSKGTAKLYGIAVRQMALRLGCKTPNEMIEAMKSGSLDPIIALDRFVQSLLDAKRAPKTVLTYYAAGKSFLDYEDIPYDEKKLKKRVFLPQDYEISVDRTPTREELERTLESASLRVKVLATTLVSSGLRIGELISLKIGQIDFSKSPAKITIAAKETKSKRARFTFLSDEAAHHLKQWLGDKKNNPNDYIFSRMNKPNEPADIGGLTEQLNRAFNRAKLRQKIEPDSARYAIHAHSLRKYFFSKCLSSGIDRGIVEGWMGHKFGLDGAYLRLGDDYLANEYLKAMPSLTIETAYRTIQDHDSVEAMQKKIEEQDKLIEGMRAKLAEHDIALSLEDMPSKTQLKKTGKLLSAMSKRERIKFLRSLKPR
jgi:integrase